MFEKNWTLSRAAWAGRAAKVRTAATSQAVEKREKVIAGLLQVYARGRRKVPKFVAGPAVWRPVRLGPATMGEPDWVAVKGRWSA